VKETIMQIDMTKDEAVALCETFNRRRKGLVDTLKSIERKRSWRPSERAIAAVPFQMDLQRIIDFQTKLEKAFGIGGW
jgi:hypothetical protein